jgi:hypothetical protein
MKSGLPFICMVTCHCYQNMLGRDAYLRFTEQAQPTRRRPWPSVKRPWLRCMVTLLSANTTPAHGQVLSYQRNVGDLQILGHLVHAKYTLDSFCIVTAG